MAKVRVLLDTNALLLPFQFGINLEAELARLLGSCDILVPSSVAGELARLRRFKHHLAASRLRLKYKVVECSAEPTVDDALANLALRLGAVVVTCDRLLQKKLLERGVRVVVMRGKNHLVLLPGGNA